MMDGPMPGTSDESLLPLTGNPSPNGQRQGDTAPMEAAGHLASHETLKSVSSIAAALRRRLRLLLVAACAGVGVALLFFVLAPPDHWATTTLLLTEPSQTAASRAMDGEAALLRTRTVAEKATRDAGLGISTDDLMSSYRVEIFGPQILKLTAAGPTAAQAVKRAKALAESFLSFRSDELRRQARVISDTLNDRIATISSQLTTINSQVAAFSSAEPRTEAAIRQYGDLLTQRSTLNERLAELRDQLSAAEFEPERVIRQSRILDSASANRFSAKKTLALNTAAGAIGGLALAAGLVTVNALTSDKVRRRSDIVSALGVPVIGLPPRRGTFRSLRRQFRRDPRREVKAVLPAIRAIQRALDRSSEAPRRLVAVSDQSDLTATLAVLSTAVTLTQAAQVVLIVDLTDRAVLARILRLETAGIVPVFNAAETAGRTYLYRPSTDDVVATDVPEKAPRDVDVVLVLANLDQAAGASHLAGWSHSSLVFAEAGRSTSTGLRGISRVLAEAGVRLVGAVLVGADRRDQSVTTFDLLPSVSEPHSSRDPSLA